MNSNENKVFYSVVEPQKNYTSVIQQLQNEILQLRNEITMMKIRLLKQQILTIRFEGLNVKQIIQHDLYTNKMQYIYDRPTPPTLQNNFEFFNKFQPAHINNKFNQNMIHTFDPNGGMAFF